MAELKLIHFPAHSLLPSSLYLDHSYCPALAPATLAALPSTRAIPESRRVLCRSSHSLHSQGWCRLSHVAAAIPNRSARLTLPLVHLSCSLLVGLPQSGVISLDALTKLLPMPSQGMSPIALDRQSSVATSHRKVFSQKPPAVKLPPDNANSKFRKPSWHRTAARAD